ncbi:MAG: family 16 glycosylhydrolase [Paludibacteraceae bacterium]|nr:family 16 glycosylhydrolase [Paludibacteraceae bacterium]
MNLFFARLIGTLESTEKMERRIVEEEERIVRYRQIEKSAELQEYLDLKKKIESREFQQKKHNLIHTKYKSTATYQKLHVYKEMLHDKQLQIYLDVEKSQRLKDYLEFRSSENYIRMQSKRELRNSLELRQMYQFEHSKEYKAYLTYKDSKTPDKYRQLLEEISTDEFKREHAFWSNPNRWKTTDEYQMEVRYKQLAVMPDIIFYLKQDVKQIEQKEQWKLTFSDEFDWLRLSDSAWRPGFVYQSPKLPAIHSFANEKQANNGGKNVGAIDGKMKIFTKEEKAIAPAWDSKLGFISKEYDYTSDIVQTAEKFRQQGGMFMAKLHVRGNIHHAFWLGSDKKLPLLSIFHYNGKHITLGNYTEKGFNGTVVRGISPRNYYIYTLRWTKHELIWYVNNKEVFRTTNNIPQEKLYMAFSSFISENQKGQEAQMHVAWVKVYSNPNM